MLTNAEALKRMDRLKGPPHYAVGHRPAAEILSKEVGADFDYLYWLPSNHDANPEGSILYTPDRRAAIEHTKRKNENGEN